MLNVYSIHIKAIAPVYISDWSSSYFVIKIEICKAEMKEYKGDGFQANVYFRFLPSLSTGLQGEQDIENWDKPRMRMETLQSSFIIFFIWKNIRE